MLITNLRPQDYSNQLEAGSHAGPPKEQTRLASAVLTLVLNSVDPLLRFYQRKIHIARLQTSPPDLHDESPYIRYHHRPTKKPLGSKMFQLFPHQPTTLQIRPKVSRLQTHSFNYK